MMPQRTDGDAPPGFVTENVSVRHLLRWVIPGPIARCWPNSAFPMDTVDVDGPLMTNVSKSSLNWHTFLWHLQISTLHAPISLPVDST